jgi:hypothetical protein
MNIRRHTVAGCASYLHDPIYAILPLFPLIIVISDISPVKQLR